MWLSLRVLDDQYLWCTKLRQVVIQGYSLWEIRRILLERRVPRRTLWIYEEKVLIGQWYWKLFRITMRWDLEYGMTNGWYEMDEIWIGF
jgi:hypothetical protein